MFSVDGEGVTDTRGYTLYFNSVLTEQLHFVLPYSGESVINAFDVTFLQM